MVNRCAVLVPVFFSLLLISSGLGAATARLSSNEIFEYETVQLELSGPRDAPPDLTPLEQDFEVLGSSSQSSMQIVNGRIEVSENAVKLTIRPRRTGRIIVPSITFGDEQTQALSLKVNALDERTQGDIDQLAFFETQVSEERPYQSEAVFLTRRLFYAPEVQIYGSLPGIPDISGATVQPVSEPSSTYTLRDGQRYNVFVSEYVLFADQPGELSVPRVEVLARMQLPGSAQGRSLGIPIRSNELTLNVRSPPEGYPAGKPWLPARKVSVESDFDTQSTEVGMPLTFNLKVSVDAALASQVAPLNLAFPASIKSYPETPRLDDQLQSGSVLGTRTEVYALIPTQPGILTLPEVRLTWWDTQNETLRETSLAAREIEVLPNPEMTATANQSQVADTGGERQAPSPEATRSASPWTLDWLDVVLALLCLTLGIGWLMSTHPEWRRLSLIVRTKRSEDSTEARAFERVKATRDQAELLAALRAWLPMVSTTEDAHLACEQLAERTEAALYAKQAARPTQSPTVAELHEAALKLRIAWLRETRRARGNALPGLYAHTAKG